MVLKCILKMCINLILNRVLISAHTASCFTPVPSRVPAVTVVLADSALASPASPGLLLPGEVMWWGKLYTHFKAKVWKRYCKLKKKKKSKSKKETLGLRCSCIFWSDRKQFLLLVIKKKIANIKIYSRLEKKKKRYHCWCAKFQLFWMHGSWHLRNE